jgi:hypothetical protein
MHERRGTDQARDSQQGFFFTLEMGANKGRIHVQKGRTVSTTCIIASRASNSWLTYGSEGYTSQTNMYKCFCKFKLRFWQREKVNFLKVMQNID